MRIIFILILFFPVFPVFSLGGSEETQMPLTVHAPTVIRAGAWTPLSIQAQIPMRIPAFQEGKARPELRCLDENNRPVTISILPPQTIPSAGEEVSYTFRITTGRETRRVALFLRDHDDNSFPIGFADVPWAIANAGERLVLGLGWTGTEKEAYRTSLMNPKLIRHSDFLEGFDAVILKSEASESLSGIDWKSFADWTGAGGVSIIYNPKDAQTLWRAAQEWPRERIYTDETNEFLVVARIGKGYLLTRDPNAPRTMEERFLLEQEAWRYVSGRLPRSPRSPEDLRIAGQEYAALSPSDDWPTPPTISMTALWPWCLLWILVWAGSYTIWPSRWDKWRRKTLVKSYILSGLCMTLLFLYYTDVPPYSEESAIYMPNPASDKRQAGLARTLIMPFGKKEVRGQPLPFGKDALRLKIDHAGESPLKWLAADSKELSHAAVEYEELSDGKGYTIRLYGYEGRRGPARRYVPILFGRRFFGTSKQSDFHSADPRWREWERLMQSVVLE